MSGKKPQVDIEDLEPTRDPVGGARKRGPIVLEGCTYQGCTNPDPDPMPTNDPVPQQRRTF